MPIDLWNIETFDADLIKHLTNNAELIINYMTTEHDIFLSHDLGRGRRKSFLRPNNPHAYAFLQLEELTGSKMERRSIRAFHYTRLTDDELDDLQHSGILVSTLERFRERLNSRVKSGDLTADVARDIFLSSPLNRGQIDIRSDRFWMVSHPLTSDDLGIKLLLSHWGGEVTYFWIEDQGILDLLTLIGLPRILEVDVPLNLTRHSYPAAKAAIASFGRSLGCIPENHAFDLYVHTDLPTTSLLGVHGKDDASFNGMGRGYPKGYVDINIGRWKELTGEDD